MVMRPEYAHVDQAQHLPRACANIRDIR